MHASQPETTCEHLSSVQICGPPDYQIIKKPQYLLRLIEGHAGPAQSSSMGGHLAFPNNLAAQGADDAVAELVRWRFGAGHNGIPALRTKPYRHRSGQAPVGLHGLELVTCPFSNMRQ
jgi:hypothetical protein